MKQQDQSRFPGVAETLKDGRAIVIRPIRTDDGEALADFYASVPPEDVRFYCPHPLDRENAFRKAADADAPLSVVLVAECRIQERGGCQPLSLRGRGQGEGDPGPTTIAGYAWFRWDGDAAPRSGFGICIRREFQNAGLGRALMTRLDEIARVLGPPVMGLTVQKANARGVALYREMGFRPVREQLRGGDGEPEYYMERKVR